MNLSKRSISISLVAMLLISMAAIFPAHAADPTIFINPADTHLFTDTYGVGSTFDIYVDVADVTNMFAYEFRLGFNNDTLKLLSATRPAGNFMEPVDPGSQFVPVWKLAESGSPTTQVGHFGFTLLAPEAGRTGGGHIVKLSFEILMAPGFGETITNLFDLFDTKLADTAASPIVHTAIDGTYELEFAAVEPHQFLSASSYTIIPGAPVVGKPTAFFDVFVDINDLLAGAWVVGIEFKLAYNGTLIQYDSIAIDPYLASFGTIYMVPVVEGVRGDGLNYLYTAVVLLPHSSPPSVWDNPISGTGHLVKITFKVIYQEAFPWVATSPLDVYDSKYSDILANPVVSDHDDVDGLVTINGYVVGRNIDLYDQYPEPFGGQGPNMPSDMFWPQKQVELYASVTYNLWPVQQKLVGFEVRDPAGNVVAILTATSDADGIAHTFYRIPWPCDNPEALFGVWTVTATVDIACVVVNDTMSFHFDYLVHWQDTYKVTTDKDTYVHGETIQVTIEFGSHSQQLHWVLITADLLDELGYSIGVAATFMTVSGATYCQLKNYTVTLPIYINKWVVAGIATLHVNAFSDWPSLGGSPWAPEYVPLPEVTILPE
jgi:hypothetical protein